MDEETEFTKLPIEERCQHKLWKARVNGYEEATKQFQQQTDEKHPEFNKYLGLVKKFVIDSNAAAQEKGLLAVLAFVENAAMAGKTCGEVISGIVSKCLGAPRAKTKELAIEICLMYIEIEKQETVQDELIKGLDNKTPKVVAACVFVLKEALRIFGIKVVNIKPLMKVLPKILEDRDKAVRDEAKHLTVEIYRWIKDAIKPLLQSLKPVQVTELEAEFAKVADERPSPSRYLRSQQEQQAKAAEVEEEEVDSGEAGGGGAVEAVDPYEFLEPVNVLGKLPKDFYELVEAKKWQERKEVLEALLPLATSPKLEAGDYADLVRVLKKLVSKDSNVLVVSLSARCLGGLATGLRKKFHPYAGQCIPAVLDKFKEKKQNVVTALKEAIDAIYLTTTLEAILEDVQGALDNKNPQIKSETASFLARAFSKATPTVLNKKLLKPLCASLTKTLNDTDPVVRDNSSEALGTAMKVVGEKSIMPFLQEVDKLKIDKVKEMCEKAVVVAAPAPAPAKSKAPPTARVAPAVKGVQSDDSPGQAETQRPATAPAAIKRTAPATAKNKPKAGVKGGAKSASAGGASRKGGKAAEAPAEVVFTEKELTDEEIQSMMEEKLSGDVITGLGSSVWKDRLTALEKFNEMVQGMDKESLEAQFLVRVLARKPGFKENNVQILKLKFDILATILENGRISRTTVGICISDLVDKVGDAKSGAAAMSALTSMADSVGLNYISLEVLQLAFAQRNPKNQTESLNWLGNAIKEFGFKIQVKGVLEYLKKGLSHTNPTVRTATITLLSVMYMYMGKTLRTLFEDEKPSLLQQIDAELAKVQDVKPPPATRGLRKSGSASLAEGQDDPGEQEGEDLNMADLVPRVDLSAMISQSVLSEMEDKNWKVRAEALQKVSNILSEAKFVEPEIGDLPAALKSRLGDSNKNLALQAINICQSLGVALGPHCNKHIRTFVPGLLSSMGDIKNHVRSAAVTCLNTWLEHCSLSCIFEGELISDSLKIENPNLRQELLGWLAEKLPDAKTVPSGELSLCLPYLFSCIEDRSPEVRKKAAEAVLPFMLHLGFEPMARATSKLKPASKTSVMAQLEKARPNLPVKPTRPSANAKGKGNNLPSSMGNEKGSEEATQEKKSIPRSSSKTKIASKSANASTQGGPRTAKKDEEDSSPGLPMNNMKDQRMIDEKNIKILKWNFTSPREEYYVLLRDLMTNANWNQGLVSNCFSNDFKQHLKALDIFIGFLSESLDSTKANLDLILKWLALRFFDTNPSVLLKGLEYLHQLFPLLASCSYRMTDVESSSFIPYLILKIGDPKDPVRKAVHDILHQIVHVYPATKVFTFVMQGLASKNARQRAECLDELGYMIENFGMKVCQPSPPVALKEIAKQISNRDNGVRTAALNCVVQAYFIEGEKVYKYVGQLSDKDMSLLEERIKRSAKTKSQVPAQELAPPTIPNYQMSPPGSNVKGVIQPPGMKQDLIDPSATIRIKRTRPALRPQSIVGIQLEAERIEQEFSQMDPSPKRFPPTLNMDDDANELLNMPDVKLPKTRLRPTASAVKLLNSSENAEMALNLVLAQLAAPDIPVVVEAFAQVEEVLHQEDKAEGAMAPRVDQLLLMGALQYRMAYSKHMADENICKADIIKLYRCVTMTLTTLFSHKTLPKKASRDVLRDLIPHLVTVILDSRLNELQEGPQVVRSLNMLVVRIIQKGNPTQVMSALIKLLFDCVGNMSASERHTELIMKCLWKMMRLMESYINELNVDHVLLEVHQFLKMYPSSFWKEKKGADMPLRTIKTLLYHLVVHKGEEIMKHLVLIPNKHESDLVNYLNKILASEKTGSSPRLNHNGSMETNGSSKNPKQSQMRLSKTSHETLADIFMKIGEKEHTKEGLRELYEFQKQHPNVNFEPFLQKSSEFFQNYIKRGLSLIEQEATQTSQTATYTTTTTNPYVSGPGFQDVICQIPPANASPVDYIEYLKTMAAKLQIDGSKYSDPAFLQNLMETVKSSKENKDGYKEDLKASVKAYNDIISRFESDTGIKIAR